MKDLELPFSFQETNEQLAPLNDVNKQDESYSGSIVDILLGKGYNGLILGGCPGGDYHCFVNMDVVLLLEDYIYLEFLLARDELSFHGGIVNDCDVNYAANFHNGRAHLKFERNCRKPTGPRVTLEKESFELEISQAAYVYTWRKLAKCCIDISEG